MTNTSHSGQTGSWRSRGDGGREGDSVDEDRAEHGAAQIGSPSCRPGAVVLISTASSMTRVHGTPAMTQAGMLDIALVACGGRDGARGAYQDYRLP